MSGNRLTIFDTTLRDGEQAPGFSLKIDEKLALARQLRSLGVDIIEAGFPIASDSDAEAVRMVATHIQGPVVAALARCHAKDIEKAAWALAPAPRRRIHVFIATSDLHLERKLRMSRDTCLSAAVAAIHHARRYTDDVQFSAEDATRSDMEFLCKVVEEEIGRDLQRRAGARQGLRSRAGPGARHLHGVEGLGDLRAVGGGDAGRAHEVDTGLLQGVVVVQEVGGGPEVMAQGTVLDLAGLGEARAAGDD